MKTMRALAASWGGFSLAFSFSSHCTILTTVVLCRGDPPPSLQEQVYTLVRVRRGDRALAPNLDCALALARSLPDALNNWSSSACEEDYAYAFASDLKRALKSALDRIWLKVGEEFPFRYPISTLNSISALDCALASAKASRALASAEASVDGLNSMRLDRALDRAGVDEILLTVCLLLQRINGAFPAYEGILLMRERQDKEETT